MPCIKPEDDLKPDDDLVRIGRGISIMYERVNIPLRDAETGEDIRPQHFRTNREMANIIFSSSFLSAFDEEERASFTRLTRNMNRNSNN